MNRVACRHSHSRASGNPGLLALLFGFMLLVASPSPAQVLTGIPPFSSETPSTFDTVDNANLNVHFSIPIFSRAGRGGLNFSYALNFNSSIWQPSSPTGYWIPNVPDWGWSYPAATLMGYITAYHQILSCNHQQFYYDQYSNWTYQDAGGAQHPFPITVSNGQANGCGSVTPRLRSNSPPSDGSGWTMTANATPYAYVTSATGVVIVPPDPGTGNNTITDPNSNVITASFSGTTYTFYDTLNSSTAVLTVNTPGGGSSDTYTYTGPNGSAHWTVKYTQKTVQTNFGCGYIGEYGPSSQYLITEIDLPDGVSKYLFAYEPTPSYPSSVTGRIASVTLPTGGTISYTYSGGSHGITCADGSTATLWRYTPDTGSNYWQYAHTGAGTTWTTTVTDPSVSQNQTVYNFQGIYETERQVYQGSASGSPLETVVTCYNGNTSSCNTTAITLPITQRNVTMTLGSEEAEAITKYNSYGLLTTADEYAFGNGAVGPFTRETMTCYGAFERPTAKLVYSATGNPTDCSGASGLVAKSAYSYDSYGNLKEEDRYNDATHYIYRKFNYGSYGVLTSATDFNSNSTSYSSFACANNTAFPGTITLPAVGSYTPTFTLTWDCNGGVLTSMEDDNNSTTTTFTYSDPNNFWRLTGTSYADGGSDTITYTDTQGAYSVTDSKLVSSSAGITS